MIWLICQPYIEKVDLSTIKRAKQRPKFGFEFRGSPGRMEDEPLAENDCGEPGM
jgi:hypothetical protein